MSEYMTSSMIWSGIGFSFGLIVGMGVRVRGKFWVDSSYRDRTIGVVVVLVALMANLQGLKFQGEQRDITRCQTDLNARFQQVLKDRSEIGDADRQNTTRMVTEVLGSNGPDDTRRALQRYVDTNNKLSERRGANPYPSITGRSCRGAK